MNHFRLVTFDVTNTLLKFRASVGQEYAQIAQSYGIHAKKDSLTQSFKLQWKQLNKLYPNFGVTSGLTSEQWWSEIVKRTFHEAGYQDINPTKLKALCAHLYKKYESKECWEIYPGAVDVLQHLKKSGVCVGVISNFDERLPQILHDVGLHHYFRFVLPSYLVQHQKPSEEIFRIALDKAQVTASEAVHIGDQVELDYLGAKNAGWNALLIARDGANQALDKVDKKDILIDILDVKKFFRLPG